MTSSRCRCGAELRRAGTRGPAPIYCSRGCRQAAYRERLYAEHQADVARLRKALVEAGQQRLRDPSNPPWIRNLIVAAQRIVAGAERRAG